MDLEDAPGSPRKKLKLDQPSSSDHLIMKSATAPTAIANEESLASTDITMSNVDFVPLQLPTDGDHSGQPVTNAPLEPSAKPFFPKAHSPYHSSMRSSHGQTSTAVDTSPDDNATRKMAPPAQDPATDPLSKEKACGITELVSPSMLGFSGILKKRYTDFMVNEILPSGEVVHLTSLKAPRRGQAKEEDHKNGKSAFEGEGSVSKDTQTPQKESTETGQVSENRAESAAATALCQSSSADVEREGTRHKQTPRPLEDAVLPHLATEPHSERSFKKAPPLNDTRNSPPRIRQQFHIRRTDASQGWVEYDKAKEDIEKEQEVDGNQTTNGATEGEPPDDLLNKEIITAMESSKDEISPADAAKTEQPETANDPKVSSQAQWRAYADLDAESSTVHKISDEDKAALLSCFSEPVVDAIKSLYNRILNQPRRATRDYGIVKSGVIDRQVRTKLHQHIRRIFHSRLETMTDSDGCMIISAMPPVANSYNSRAPPGPNDPSGYPSSRGNNQGSKGKSGNPSWHELGGEFLHFTLYKENKDTMECISFLSRVLKLGPKAFEFAGTKDRRAVSAQRVSVYRQSVGRMIDAGKALRNAYIGNYEYRPNALQLGELTGNEFTITLRDCTFDDPATPGIGVKLAHSIVAKAVENLVQRGFINYYGLQRFGTFSTGTDEIGIKLLQGDFKGAVEGILYYTPESLAAAQDPMSADDRMSRDDKARSHAIHTFQTTGKSQRALTDLPRKFSAETAIIRHLGSRPNQAHDYLGGILSIQRNLRLMYVHAYQSLVWNLAASKRWSIYGDSVVEGDLVLVTEHAGKEEAPVKVEEVDEDGEPIIQPATEDRATNVEDIFTRARALSKDEAESGKYTIFDIVLPTPGFDILYPANVMQEFYAEFMASPRGGGLDLHDMRRPHKDFSLSGSYRKVLAKPGKNISFEIKQYEKDDEQFVETDFDRLNEARNVTKHGQVHHAKKNDAEDAKGYGTGEEEQWKRIQEASKDHIVIDGQARKSEDDDGANATEGVPLHANTAEEVKAAEVVKDVNKKIAVVLKLQLGSSQYATMALRELMKAGGIKTYKPDFGGGR